MDVKPERPTCHSGENVDGAVKDPAELGRGNLGESVHGVAAHDLEVVRTHVGLDPSRVVALGLHALVRLHRVRVQSKGWKY